MGKYDDKIETLEEPVTRLESLQFFQTQPHKCSYLPEKSATTAFLNPQQSIGPEIYAQLADYGFRRSGQHIYKPLCQDCNACVPIRIPVEHFKPTRSQKRTWKYNQDINITAVETIDTEEHYQLYARYINQRHADGDMYPASAEQFQSFLAEPWLSTVFYEFRLDGKLIATAVTDMMDNGISAIYTYYDPLENKRSLGRLAILFLIQLAKKQQLPCVYLGYWIQDCHKMEYKARYRALEIHHNGQWLRVL